LHSNIFFIKGKNKPFPGMLPLCRQGLIVPKKPSLYSCAEPMLGQYVYVVEKGKDVALRLCEVEVYVNSKFFTLAHSKQLQTNGDEGTK